MDGKSRTLYVPARHVAEVTASIELWKRVRQGLKELSAAAREAYANAFADLRGGARSGKPRGAGAKRRGESEPRAKSSRASKPATTRTGAPASPRRPSRSRCLYMDDTVVCTFLAVTMLKCRSRNAVDGCRNSEGMASSMLYLSDQGWWPEGEKFTTACTGTLVYRTRCWDCEKVKVVNTSLVKRLINAKFFEKDRVFGKYYALAVDAVHRDERRSGRGEGLPKKEKKTIALEVKLITKTGMAVTVCSEGVEPYDDKKEKQDCEINAFKRMAPVLRKLMRKHQLCLVGDALYGCDSVWRICEGYGWKYVTTFKEGRMPDVYENVRLRFEGGDCESGEMLKADDSPRFGTMKWVVGIETNAPDKYRINVVYGKVSILGDLTKKGKQRRPYVGMFATQTLEHRERVQGAEAQRVRAQAQVRERHERQQGVVLPHADRVDAVADVPARLPAEARDRMPKDDASPLVRGDSDIHPAPRLRHACGSLQAHVPQEPLTAKRTRRSDPTSRVLRTSRSNAEDGNALPENAPHAQKTPQCFKIPGYGETK